jgi:hypothetical protein
MQWQPSDIAIFIVAAAIALLLCRLLQSVKRQRGKNMEHRFFV